MQNEKQLPTKILGRTELEVTQLGFGAMELRGASSFRGRETIDEEAEQVLNGALDLGINFIDTAPDYGVSEERIDKYISHRRDEFYLATKCGCNISPEGIRQEPAHVWAAERFRKNIDQSLERMKTDHVYILQMHNPSVEEVEQNGLIAVLQEIRDAGKTRFIGVSSTAPHLSAFVRMGVFDTFQIPYSALERKHEQMIKEAAEAGVGIIIRGGIAKGHRDTQERGDKWDRAQLNDLLGGMNRYEFVLRFTLSHFGCHTTIVGTADLDHLQSNATAAQAGPLPPDLYEQVKQRMNEIGEKPAD